MGIYKKKNRLLTDNQKVDFHTKALKYLRQNTRRCDACGGGQFAKLLGRIYPESIRIGKRKIDNLNYVSNLSDYGDVIGSNSDKKLDEST